MLRSRILSWTLCGLLLAAPVLGQIKPKDDEYPKIAPACDSTQVVQLAQYLDEKLPAEGVTYKGKTASVTVDGVKHTVRLDKRNDKITFSTPNFEVADEGYDCRPNYFKEGRRQVYNTFGGSNPSWQYDTSDPTLLPRIKDAFRTEVELFFERYRRSSP